jgi:hypothetical protein
MLDDHGEYCRAGTWSEVTRCWEQSPRPARQTKFRSLRGTTLNAFNRAPVMRMKPSWRATAIQYFGRNSFRIAATSCGENWKNSSSKIDSSGGSSPIPRKRSRQCAIPAPLHARLVAPSVACCRGIYGKNHKPLTRRELSGTSSASS